MKSLKKLIARAKQLFPNSSRNERKQWVRWSFSLYASGKHRFLSMQDSKAN